MDYSIFATDVFQKTVSGPLSFEGVGVHSGEVMTMVLHPAPVGHGIVFVRTDITDGRNRIPALWDRVADTRLCTVIANESGVSVGTVEHLMAALRGCGIDNVRIDIDGPEVPVMDGSSKPFVEAIERAGPRVQDQTRRMIKVLKPVCVERDGKQASLKPSERSMFSGEIDFAHEDIGRQTYETELVNGNFIHELSEARTFGFLHEVEYLRAQGLALGGSLDNAIVLDRDGIMNKDGLRYKDEFIRHKLLDAVGDLYLAGAPIIGAYEGSKAGHALNNELLRALFADEEAWTYVDPGMTPDSAVLTDQYCTV